MGYLNEDGLTRYDGLLKNWVTFKSGTVDGIEPLLNWQKTEDAASVTCYPVSASPLEPNVSFMFTEMPPLDGNPKSSTNPSTIMGISSITVTKCETTGIDSTDYTIALGSTYYGGTLDVASGLITVTWDAIAITGEEVWNTYSTSDEGRVCYYSNLGLSSGTMSVTPNATTRFCNYFTYSSNDIGGYNYSTWGSSPRVYFNAPVTDFPTVDSFKEWLAAKYTTGTPVVLGFLRGTPLTVSITPTQIYSLSQIDEFTPRLNTIYSDQQSVQVGYAKSPIRTEQELSNAIVSLGGNV